MRKRIKGRLQALRQDGPRAWPDKVTIAVLQLAVLYGASVMGVTDSDLSRMRTLVATSIFSQSAGRSLNLSFAFREKDIIDPLFRANRSLVYAWAVAWWSSSAPLAILWAAFHHSLQ